MVKIAFLSCCDAIRDARQKAWDELAEVHRPEHIVMLGDSIYMDYGLGHKYDNGQPRGAPLADFSAEMHRAYTLQWRVASFRRAIRDARVHAIWDDHDFGWNNACGALPDTPRDKVNLSHALFQQFRQALVQKPADYGPNPWPQGSGAPPAGSIAAMVELPHRVRLHLTDGRSFREAEGGSILGQAQRHALEQALVQIDAAEPGVLHLIARGTDAADWARSPDNDWLRGLATRHDILVLSGDRHNLKLDAAAWPLEAVSSAMAQTTPPIPSPIKRSEVFGILDIDDASLRVSLYHRGELKKTRLIDRGQWPRQVPQGASSNCPASSAAIGRPR
ncbi:hypothetical protein [Pelomonas sp. KK5]|uniref:hypothetical protein n=1 Tax=Pelomonas sp. KK5 TaxID=1855730 RepID=UPI00097BCF8B|nr:hypothetical protein [Pelomonas sp. KK5]